MVLASKKRNKNKKWEKFYLDATERKVFERAFSLYIATHGSRSSASEFCREQVLSGCRQILQYTEERKRLAAERQLGEVSAL